MALGEERAEQHEELTIEQIAARTGMTVRNIRSHRARGLLPAPVVRDRVGLYGPEHLARLRLIQELQGEGFNLGGIKRLLERTRPEQLLDLRHVVAAPFETEEPQVLTASELAERFGAATDPELLRRAERLGVLVALDDGTYEAPSPALIEVAAELVARGVPLAHVLAVLAKVQDRCAAIAREFVRLSSTTCGSRSPPRSTPSRSGRPCSSRSSGCARSPRARCSPSTRRR